MDQALRIKTYTPDATGYAPRIRSEQWDQYKALLKHLHDEGRKRADMLEILRKQGFSPSMGQLNAKMTAWGFKVYGTQIDAPAPDLHVATQMSFSGSDDTIMGDTARHHPYLSPLSGASTSSTTLCEQDMPWNSTSIDHDTPFNQAISTKCLSLVGTYWPSTKPPDLGLRPPNGNDIDATEDQHLSSVTSVADFLCAVHCFETAFDLYYYVMEHFASQLTSEMSLIQMLVRCAMSATTDAQSSFVIPILRIALDYCDAYGIKELGVCFLTLLQSLGEETTLQHNTTWSSELEHARDIALILTVDLEGDFLTHQKAWLQQQLAGCDENCSTLAHLSSWCQDTFSFYHFENKALGNFTSRALEGYIPEMNAQEDEFQALVSALVIDYLNSPGPTMKKAISECKENECIFRWGLSPLTSLVIMAHVLLEPSKPSSDFPEGSYLERRAQAYVESRSLTPTQELSMFASTSSNERCTAFVDTFLKQFNTTLPFRRFVSNVKCGWDRIWAAKRLASILQKSGVGMLPHAGLPSARRAFLKTMVAPFREDTPVPYDRQSIVSESSGSMQEFKRLALQAGRKTDGSVSKTPSDAMSIDTRSSWSFHKVTGFSRASISSAASLFSRKDENDEVEDYRQFVKQNN